jgi:cellobiose phosphorylase
MTASTGAPTRTTALPDGGVRLTTADTRWPAVALLSNGQYGVMITAAGAGYSMWRDLDVTRWREDGTRDCWGQFCYVRDRGERTGWSVGRHLLGRPADD